MVLTAASVGWVERQRNPPFNLTVGFRFAPTHPTCKFLILLLTTKMRNFMSQFDNDVYKQVTSFFAQQSNITFVLLFGSQVNGTTNPHSDWDFAVWFNNSPIEERFSQKEQLRNQLSKLIKTSKIDVVDLQFASLSLKSSIVENNIILKGANLLELMLFYKRVWSLEEDFYWRLKHENRTISS